jgi:hypothetical protein
METLMNRSAIASAACVLLVASSSPAPASADLRASRAQVAPRGSHPHGLSYAQWSARWWQWGLEYPVAGHPFIDSPDFSVSARQTGRVWFLGAPFGATTRAITIPSGTALFFCLLAAEESSNEGFATASEQREAAQFLADHIRDLFCTIDGHPVENLTDFRFTSPQFSFTAPSPWIEDPAPSGPGTSVADGYSLFLEPLSVGQHTLHYGGAFHFSIAEGDPFDLELPLDMTYNVTVAP